MAKQDIQADHQTDQRCAEYLKAIGDPIRLKIVKALQTCPFTVSDLAEFLELDIQKVSHHLRILYHADLVKIQKDGKYPLVQGVELGLLHDWYPSIK